MKRAFSESDLAAFRALTATQTARLLGLHCKPDPDYSPIKNEASSRVYISVGSTVFEIVETGPENRLHIVSVLCIISVLIRFAQIRYERSNDHGTSGHHF